MELTVKDVLELKLQILAAQMSCGSYKIPDMGSLKFPVSIKIDKDNKIIFEIEGNMQSDLSKDIQKEVMKESMEFVNVGISEFLRRQFPFLNYDSKSNIIGFWYYKFGHLKHAIFENNEFIILDR